MVLYKSGAYQKSRGYNRHQKVVFSPMGSLNEKNIFQIGHLIRIEILLVRALKRQSTVHILIILLSKYL